MGGIDPATVKARMGHALSKRLELAIFTPNAAFACVEQ